MGVIGCLLIIVVFCTLKCIYKLFSRDCIHEEQVAGFIGLTTMSTITNKNGGDVGSHPADIRVPQLGLSEKALGP